MHVLSRISGTRERLGLAAILHVYQIPLPIVAGRGACSRHRWDEEFGNYDTDEDVF